MAAARAWNLRYALRSLRRSPAFVALTVSTLGLAIGAVAGDLERGRHRAPRSAAVPARRSAGRSSRAPRRARTCRRSSRSPPSSTSSTASRPTCSTASPSSNSFTSTLRTDDRVERIRMSMPTADPVRHPRGPTDPRPPAGAGGRGSRRGDQPHPVARLVRRRSGGDRPHLSDVGASRTVIGVMGPEFRFPDDGSLLWIPGGVPRGGLRAGPLRHAAGGSPRSRASRREALVEQLATRGPPAPRALRRIARLRAPDRAAPADRAPARGGDRRPGGRRRCGCSSGRRPSSS